MWHIAPEDIPKFAEAITEVVKALGAGAQRLDQVVDLGDQTYPVKITGYWAGDVMRIDIKLQRGS